MGADCPSPPLWSRYEVRKKKKQAACTAEMAELVLAKYTDKVGTNKRSWQLQVGARRSVDLISRLAVPGPVHPTPASAARCCSLAGSRWVILPPCTPSLQCGIVYCMARAECERVADDLEGKFAETLGNLPPGRRRVK